MGSRVRYSWLAFYRELVRRGEQTLNFFIDSLRARDPDLRTKAQSSSAFAIAFLRSVDLFPFTFITYPNGAVLRNLITAITCLIMLKLFLHRASLPIRVCLR